MWSVFVNKLSESAMIRAEHDFYVLMHYNARSYNGRVTMSHASVDRVNFSLIGLFNKCEQ